MVSAVREVYRDWTAGYPGTGNNGFGVRPLAWADASTLVFGSEAINGFTQVLAATITAAPAPSPGHTRPSSMLAATPAPAPIRQLTNGSCENQDWVLGVGAVAVDGASLLVATK